MSDDAEPNKSPDEFLKYWSNLAKTDPKRFEAERKAEIKKVILQARPELQQGLWDYQRSLDVKKMGEARRAVKKARQSLRMKLKNLRVMQARLV